MQVPLLLSQGIPLQQENPLGPGHAPETVVPEHSDERMQSPVVWQGMLVQHWMFEAPEQ
jgi:hypothetical protein